MLVHVGSALGLQTDVVLTDGTQPVGRGIGPALEARDLLAVLQCSEGAPMDLRKRAAFLAGAILERGGVCRGGEGLATALEVLDDGRAWRKFQAICVAQGGLRVPPTAAHRVEATADRAGRVAAIDNRRLAKLAKLAGAPKSPAAGVDLLVHVDDVVEPGQTVLSVHAAAPGELEYALTYLRAHPDLVTFTEPGR